VKLGPQDATLLVSTFRDGMAAAAGHDLIIEVTGWSADYAEGKLELTADPASFVVRDSANGLKPLSDKDRRDIVANVTDKILGTAPIVFRSTGPGTGDLALAGKSRPLSFTLTTDPDGTFTAAAVVKQTDWGIKPYSAMFGALKVRDEVEISARGTFPAG
jgi:hypothetical protein